jgi:hypothetical protein
VALKKCVVAAANDVDDCVANANDVVACVGHDVPKAEVPRTIGSDGQGASLR